MSNLSELSDSGSILYGGRYELIDLVGAGGAGTVYRARDIELDEIVALKVLRKELIRAPAVVERFRSEVKLARRITHRNVTRMFDIGEHGGERFLTMEYVEGRMLSARMSSGGQRRSAPLPLPLILDITQQVCAGLAAAHAVGVIHRDLKPDNIILENTGRVVITDFGIARALQPREIATAATGEFIGTPEYMSPEQAEGGAIDFRTDIYSLGIMLFEMLTGALPFTGATPLVTAAARLLKPAPDPRSIRSSITDEVAQVVLCCLCRQPQDRFSSAEEVAAALTAALPELDGAAAGHASITGAHPVTVHPITQPGGGTTGHGSHSNHSQPMHSTEPTLALPQPLSALADKPAQSIAVLPFRNQGPPEDQYLAEGLTDDLIDTLSMVQGLRVRSRGALWNAGTGVTTTPPADPLAIGRAAGVEVLVDGTVRRIGEMLRVAARLVKVEDGVQIWAQRFDRQASAVLQINDEVAQAVAGALTGRDLGAPRPVLQDSQAVDLYLRARALYQRGDRESVAQSAQLLEQGLALRPDDPTLLTIYVQVLGRQWFFGGKGLGERVQEMAERAVAAAPDRPETRVALAMTRFHHSDAVGAVRELLETLQRAPELSDAHDLLGRILIETGPVLVGLHHLDHALMLNPRLLRIAFDRSRVHGLMGDWPTADRIIAEGESAGLPGPGMWIHRARMLFWRRDHQGAERLLLRLSPEDRQVSTARRLLEVLAGRRRADAAELLESWAGFDSSSPRGHSFYYQITTELHAFCDERDQAIRSLARAVDIGLFDMTWLDGCPILDPLRADPRFHALRKIVAGRTDRVKEALRLRHVARNP